MIRSRPSRRELCRSLAGGAALLPLLDATREARGAGYPRRLVIVVATNGVLQKEFWPAAGGDLSAQTLPALTAPLEPHKSDLLFVGGLEARNYTDAVNPGGGHFTYPILFTGSRGLKLGAGNYEQTLAAGPTVDQVIATEIAKRVSRPLRSLHLGLHEATAGAIANMYCCFYRDRGAPIVPEINPARAFNTLFAASDKASAPDFERIRAERRSILDFVARGLTRFYARLGREDATKVEAHLQSVREIENQIAQLGSTRCDTLPTVPATDPSSSADYPKNMAAQMDLIVAALKCDMTRVATLQLGSFNGDRLMFPWLGIGGAGLKDFPVRHYHDIAHSPGVNNDDKRRVDVWYMQQFAALIQRLKNVPEGGGTMLDNTAVLWINHMGDGSLHDWHNLPCIIAGRCGGFFKPGRYVGAGQETPVNGLLIGLANAMEVPIATFGDPMYGGLHPQLSA